MLLDAGADVNAVGYHGETVLTPAIQSNNTTLIQLLLTHGADVNTPVLRWYSYPKIGDPIHQRKGGGVSKPVAEHVEYVSQDEGVVVGRPLDFAIKNGNLEIVQYLVRAQIDFNLPGKNGCSPAEYAWRLVKEEIYNYLTGEGARRLKISPPPRVDTDVVMLEA